MKTFTISILLLSVVCTKGVRNPAETTGAMNGMMLDIDWSGLVNQMQPAPQPMPAQPEYGVIQEQVQVIPEPAPVPLVEARPEFMEVSSAEQLGLPNVNTVADLIARSWANTWHMISSDPKSSISVIYAGYKALEGVDGVHWRLVFKLVGAGNTEFIGLDVAVLANGMVDVFRNITTRNLTDISMLFGVNVSAGSYISLQYLRESFLHNSIMIINPNYNAAQANQTGFDIEWTRVQVQEVAPAPVLDVVLNNIGGQQQPEYGVLDTSVDIGSSGGNSDLGMF